MYFLDRKHAGVVERGLQALQSMCRVLLRQGDTLSVLNLQSEQYDRWGFLHALDEPNFYPCPAGANSHRAVMALSAAQPQEPPSRWSLFPIVIV